MNKPVLCTTQTWIRGWETLSGSWKWCAVQQPLHPPTAPFLADYPVKQVLIRNTAYATHGHISSSLYQTSQPQFQTPPTHSTHCFYPLFLPTVSTHSTLPTHPTYLLTLTNPHNNHIPIPKTSSIHPGFPNITYHKSPTPYLTSNGAS